MTVAWPGGLLASQKPPVSGRDLPPLAWFWGQFCAAPLVVFEPPTCAPKRSWNLGLGYGWGLSVHCLEAPLL